ncbi:hypothetical protein E2C01_090419 [Portunus trituberculatus]|uniref:Uncharacterized protein n=1 Tax=Portunus trituberculatus TaxID=210409 RepID=A0A5B7JQA7_PORTR|nr:hypothetical protein [Portunus trituberculatus]
MQHVRRARHRGQDTASLPARFHSVSTPYPHPPAKIHVLPSHRHQHHGHSRSPPLLPSIHGQDI